VTDICQVAPQSTARYSKHYTDDWPATQPHTFQAVHGEMWGVRWECTYLRPKDSSAVVGVRDRATGKAS